MKNKILIFFDTDIVIRAFYQSNTFKTLEKHFDLEYVFPIDPSSKKKYVNINFDIFKNKKTHFVNIKRKRMGIWYHLFAAKLINLHRGKSTYKSILDSKLKLELTPKLLFLINLLSYPGIFNCFKFTLKVILGKNKEINSLLKKNKPIFVIYPSVLTGPFISELPREAKSLGIKTMICMNSWDNPMSKAIPNELPDHLIVWGDDSKKQSIDLLGVPEERIHTFGAAQFQIYKNKSSLTKTSLQQKFQVPTSKRYVLYAGVGESTDETKYLSLLDNAIENNLLKNTHIIYRPHPWRGKLQDGELDFFEMNYKNISMDPHMKNYYKNTIINPDRKFFMIKYSITRDLLQLIDGVISPRSTILLEGAILGKLPLVCFPENIKNPVFNKENIHFKNFCKLPNVISCFTIDEFESKIKIFNENLQQKSIEKKLIKDCNYIVNMNGLSYGEKIKSLIMGDTKI